MKQSDINPRGHAIECRINAEDASKNFQPSPGTIGMCHQPSGFRTRVDGSIFQGYKVTPYYDSMVCKVITHGRNRTEAIQRMNRSSGKPLLERHYVEPIIQRRNVLATMKYSCMTTWSIIVHVVRP